MERVIETTYYILKAEMKDGNTRFLCVNPLSFDETDGPKQEKFTVTMKGDKAEPWDKVPDNLDELIANCREKDEIAKLVPIEVTEKTRTTINFKEL